MTIKDALVLAASNQEIDENIILCVGFVDIMQDRDIEDIQIDLIDTVRAFRNRGINPIVCTLPPLINNQNDPSVMNKINQLNDFIHKWKSSLSWQVVDLYRLFVTQNGIQSRLYQR